MASAWGSSWGVAWGDSWGSLSPIPPGTGVTGGAGWPVDWQGERRELTLEEQPEKHLRHILDKVVSEYYGEIINSDLPRVAKAEAAAVVRPFTAKSNGARIPKVKSIDWDALQKDVNAVNELLLIWQQNIADDEEEEEFILVMMQTPDEMHEHIKMMAQALMQLSDVLRHLTDPETKKFGRVIKFVNKAA